VWVNKHLPRRVKVDYFHEALTHGDTAAIRLAFKKPQHIAGDRVSDAGETDSQKSARPISIYLIGPPSAVGARCLFRPNHPQEK